MSSGTFTDFLNSLREFESGTSLAGIDQTQAAIILEEFRHNLDRIESGLAAQGWSLDDVVSQNVTVTEADGSQSQLQLSVSGILAAAHLHGASNTLDFLVHGTVTPDGTGATILDYLERFGGYDAPSVADLRMGDLTLLEADDTLAASANGLPTPDNDNDAGHAANDVIPGYIVTESTPGDPSEIFLRLYDFTTDSFAVTGADGIHADNGDDVIFTFGDSSMAFAGDDFQHTGDSDGVLFGGTGSDHLVGGAGNDIPQGETFGAYQASELFALAAGDGQDFTRDFQSGIDILDFSAFGEDAIILTDDHGDGFAGIGGDDIGVTMEGVRVTELSDDDLLVTLLDDDFGILAN